MSGVELRLLQRKEHMASVLLPISKATFAQGMEPPKYGISIIGMGHTCTCTVYVTVL